jgi:transcriptional regulator with XRE-family HTH domain
LKEYRQKAGLTQEELSRECNYDKTYVGKIERGDTNPSIEAILGISDVLEVPFVKLFQGSVSSDPDEFEASLEAPSEKIGKLFIDVFENTPSICFLTNEKGDILRLNTAAERFMKADVNTVVGERMTELSIWGQVGIAPEIIQDMIELGSFGKQASRRHTLRYKGQERDVQFRVSYAGGEETDDRYLIFQLFFIEETTDRTLIGDHFDLLRG